ncbi:unnamed protein product [Ambrosiozyma monospora]|uniref:Unnamed protein product n=1 Tax=Ambrosiozyma monospora TaxID=43982 RepID=A0ACB5T9D8_AMBMO|nr:unnamed protein product [Ambrosiozyma monospora]
MPSAGFQSIQGAFLPAVKGNLFEAINLGMSLVSDDFSDPDLRHTTNHFIIISPGSGLFDVDYSLLVQTSKVLSIMDATIDLICLSQPPLHVVPLLRYTDGKNKVKHCIPSWMDISFWNDYSQSIQQWLPRCKIYELQMMGIMENELSSISVDRQNFKNNRSVMDAVDNFENDIFAKPESTAVKPALVQMQRRYSPYSRPKQKKPSPSQVPIFMRRKGEYYDDERKPSPIQGHETESITTNLPFFTEQKGTPITPTIRGETKIVTSKSTVTALSQIREVMDKNTASKSGGALKYVKRMISTPMLRAASPSIKPTVSKDSKASETDADTTVMSDVDLEISTMVLDKKHNIQKGDYEDVLQSKDSKSTLISGGVPVSTVSTELDSTPLIPVVSQNRRKPMNKAKKFTKSSILNLYWTNVENPSNAETSELIGMVSYGRWEFVFPKNVRRDTVKWKSLTTPASLPLTTRIFPSDVDFMKNFTFRSYDIQLTGSDVNAKSTVKTLMRNMIAMRLSLGFQICVGENVAKVDSQSIGVPTLFTKFIDETSPLGSGLYMSLGHEIHKLLLDSYNDKVNVKVYTRNTKADEDVLPVAENKDYVEYIRTRYAVEYNPVTVKGSLSEARNRYNWNRLDQMMAGYDEDDNDKKMHRLKFVILPTEVHDNAYRIRSEKLSEEEIRLEGIRSLLFEYCFE